jgi:hypothetical protein
MLTTGNEACWKTYTLKTASRWDDDNKLNLRG